MNHSCFGNKVTYIHLLFQRNIDVYEAISCKTNIDFLLNKQLQLEKIEALWNKNKQRL